MALSVKIPFAGVFRGFFRQAGKPQAAAPSPLAKNLSPAPASAISTAAAMHALNPFPAASNEVEIPLAAVLNGLPLELRAKIMSAPAPQATLRLNADAIVSQLGSGSVKITFGELRRLAPGLIANSGGEHDSRTVTLPLPEILTRLNPELLSRRAVKKISVTDDIAGPFAERGRGVNFTTTPLKAAAAPVPSPFSAPAAAPQKQFEATPLEPSAPIAFTARAITPAAAPLEQSRFAAPIQAAPGTLSVALAALAENWPALVQQEISRPPFATARVTLPEALVAAGLKCGRVVMTWKQLRTLVAADSTASIHDALELQLPLKVVAPLFLAAKKNELPAPVKVAVKAEIPDLFFGFPQPSAAPVVPGLPPLPKPPTESADTNYFVPGVQSQSPAAETSVGVRPEENVQTDFSSRQATPKEVVARARALPGVAGAVVALPDGLRVASEVPAELNADTLAAFLPQIFERVNQSTRELRMGALNNVNFTVGNVPWKIFRVNSVYFAAFGRAGEALPTAQLAQLAAEIDRKK